jgi:hypothetical protein
MTMVFDGLGRFHLGFVDPKDNKPYEFMFNTHDTLALYQFLSSNREEFFDKVVSEYGVIIEQTQAPSQRSLTPLQRLLSGT